MIPAAWPCDAAERSTGIAAFTSGSGTAVADDGVHQEITIASMESSAPSSIKRLDLDSLMHSKGCTADGQVGAHAPACAVVGHGDAPTHMQTLQRCDLSLGQLVPFQHGAQGRQHIRLEEQVPMPASVHETHEAYDRAAGATSLDGQMLLSELI